MDSSDQNLASNRARLQTIGCVCAGGAALLAVLVYAKALLAPIVVAALLRILFGPVVRRLKRWHIPTTLSALAITAFLVGTMVFGVFYLSEPAADWIENAPERLEVVKDKVGDWNHSLDELDHAIDALGNLGERQRETEAVVEVREPSMLKQIFSQTWQVTLGILTAIILLFFMLARGDALAQKLPDLLPRKDRRLVTEAYEDIEERISTYLLTITAINIVFGASVGVVMSILGLPSPLLWGVAAASLNFIPYLGALIGASLMTFVSLFVFDSTLHVLLPPMCYLALNGTEAYVLTPAILGQTLSVSPVAVLLSLMFWGWVWGVVGVIIAVPLLIAIQVGCGNARWAQGVCVLLRD